MDLSFMDDLAIGCVAWLNNDCDCSSVFFILGFDLFLYNHLVFVEFGFECGSEL